VSIYIFRDLPIIIETWATIDIIDKPFSKSEFDNSKSKFFFNVNVRYSWGKYYIVLESSKQLSFFFFMTGASYHIQARGATFSDRFISYQEFHRKFCLECKVLLGENLTTHHILLVMEVKVQRRERRSHD